MVGSLRLHASRVFMPFASAPSGLVFKRDNADVMNNFFVNIVTRSYTNIEEYLQARQENVEMQKQKETLKELEGIQKSWTSGIYQEVSSQFDTFDKHILGFNKKLEDQNKQEDDLIKSQKSRGIIQEQIKELEDY